MNLTTLKKVLREYRDKSLAVANSLGGEVGYAFCAVCSIVQFAMVPVQSTMSALSFDAKVLLSATAI